MRISDTLSVIASIALMGAVVGTAKLCRAETRVALVNGALNSGAAASAIAELRGELARLGLKPMEAGPIGFALEAPLATEPGATPGLERGRSLLAEVKSSFFEYEASLARILEVEGAFVSAAGDPAARALLFDTNILLGRLHAEHGAKDAAMASFRLARRLDPDRRELDPAVHPPKVVKLFAKATKVEARRAPLRVETERPGAQVLLDGKPAGVTPLTLPDVEVGDHYVTVRRAGFTSWGKRVVVGASGGNVNLVLKPLPEAERVRALRAGLLAPETDERIWKRTAAELAPLLSAGIVILVRGEAKLEAAIYEADTRSLSTWLAVAPGDDLRTALAALAPDKPVAVMPAEGTSGAGSATGATSPPAEGKDPAKRKKSRLVAGVLIGTGTTIGVAGTTVAVILLVAALNPPTYMFDSYAWTN